MNKIEELRQLWWDRRNRLVHDATRENAQMDTFSNRLFNWKILKPAIERLAQAEQLEECADEIEKLT